MFQFLKKKSDNNLYAPVKGKCIDIEDVEDQVFSSKVMGDGFAIIPSDDKIQSPCDGIITMIFPTKHAFGIKMHDGKEILVHIGIDTVHLNGEGFTVYKKINDSVKVGETIIKLDKAFIESQSYNLTTMVIITNETEVVIKNKIGENVDDQELIVQY